MSDIRAWITAALLLLIAACGFHLRGPIELPPAFDVTFIDWQPADPPYLFQRRLQESLRAAGATVSPVVTDAGAILRIHEAETGRRVLSVSATNRPQEYEVFVRVVFEVVGGESVQLGPETRTLVRDYSYNPAQELSKQQEAQDIENALVEQMVRLIVRRLATATRST